LSPKVLLTNTTWWPCASRIAIALTGAKCSVAAVYPRQGHPLRKTSAVQQRFVYGALDPVSSILKAIDAWKPDIIVPCDDRAVQHLHEIFSSESGTAAGKIIERSLGSPASYPVVLNRYALIEIARQEGILVPPTLLINSSGDLKLWGERHPLPWVLKTDGSWGGHGVRIAGAVKEAEGFVAAMNRPLSTARAVKRLLVDRDAFWLRSWWKRSKSGVVAQAYVSGRPANCAVFCWQGKVLAGIAVEVVASQGITGAATVVRVIKSPQMAVAAELLAGRLGLSGFFGLDFVIEEATGAAYLIEMNPRVTPLCHLQLGTGRNMVHALRAQLTGEPLEEAAPVTGNVQIAYYPQAWHRGCDRELVDSSYNDIPWQDPVLSQELLKLPWPDRGMLARVVNHLRQNGLAQMRWLSAEARITTSLCDAEWSESTAPPAINGVKL